MLIHQVAERHPRFYRLQLLRIADQDQFRAELGGLGGDAGELAGSDHAGLVHDQNIALFKGMTTLDNIMPGRMPLMKTPMWQQAMWWGAAEREETENRQRVEEIIDFLEIQSIRKTPVGRLPYGLQKRVELGRALAAEPSFIICDEVTSALDQLVAEGILKLLDKLQEDLNLAYMFITHDLATVRSIADEVVVMQKGKVVEQGPKDKMFTPPHHPYTDLLLSSVPEMDPNWLTTLLEERGTDSIGEAANV